MIYSSLSFSLSSLLGIMSDSAAPDISTFTRKVPGKIQFMVLDQGLSCGRRCLVG